jgi:hypothetical protein
MSAVIRFTAVRTGSAGPPATSHCSGHRASASRRTCRSSRRRRRSRPHARRRRVGQRRRTGGLWRVRIPVLGMPPNEVAGTRRRAGRRVRVRSPATARSGRPSPLRPIAEGATPCGAQPFLGPPQRNLTGQPLVDTSVNERRSQAHDR